MFLQAEDIFLRALEPEDLSYLYLLENDVNLWEFGHTQTPFSKFILKQYIENSHQDIYQAKQLRLVISKKENNQILGLVDFYDFDPQNQRVGIGIVIYQLKDRAKGYALQTLKLLIEYAFTILHCHLVYATIAVSNKASIALFEKLGFQCSGIQKQWIKKGNTREDQAIYQLISNL